jgi:hypothetical protein
MQDRWNAFVRSVRTLVQGAITAGAVAAWEALHSAWTGGTYNVRLLTMAMVAAGAGAVVTYVFNLIAPRLGVTDSPSWEAFVRAGRTLVQTLVGVGAVALWDAVYATWTGGNHNPRDIVAAGAAAVGTAVVAYLHNLIQRFEGERASSN